MAAKIISLCEYRKKKQDENARKRLIGRGFPDDFNPFESTYGFFSGLSVFALTKDEEDDESKT